MIATDPVRGRRSAAIRASGLVAGYGGTPVVDHLDVCVQPGQVLAVLGANGAGKTTLLATLAGALSPIQGDIEIDGRRPASSQYRRARGGVAYVPEERAVFMDLTVDENLRVARVDGAAVFELFPELAAHRRKRAGLLSGGQQQILALGRALASDPKVLLADELSLGLAPQVTNRLLGAVRQAADRGVGVILVEQHAHKALAIADHAVVLDRGQVSLRGTATEVRDRFGDLRGHYLGGHRDDVDDANDARAAITGPPRVTAKTLVLLVALTLASKAMGRRDGRNLRRCADPSAHG